MLSIFFEATVQLPLRISAIVGRYPPIPHIESHRQAKQYLLNRLHQFRERFCLLSEKVCIPRVSKPIPSASASFSSFSSHGKIENEQRLIWGLRCASSPALLLGCVAL